ncbi:undecaprenyl-diphosphate phosphatase [Ruminococcus sp. CLA-AA-H200]|uniref:Undecaprenyl-diphosphatase n=1 Tax=Ruminococcus turbiniformis TaxID=2881258 RepID=A0ABS8FZL6_9FIRM|nr:undecaprenyl-diphosphate phosphatase [Ruminococcus turbiniformis]MCC2255456.1 undecaprenyl-diphosphate phosphatase [Ruminococcus turbiniformis]
MLDALKVIIFGIVEGITEWLPISSTGHLLLLNEFLTLSQGEDFFEMFEVVIQLGAILAVVVIYFHKLNPFSPKKTQKQKMMTIQMWIKVIIGCLPAAVVGLLFNDLIDSVLYHWYVVAATLIIYGILFIVVENYQKGKEPAVTKISQLTVPMLLIIGVFQMLALIPGTSRSGATIVGALLIGVSRSVATEFTFFLAIPVMFGASALKLIKYGLNFTGMQVFLLILGMAVSFVVSVIAIKFLLKYIKNHDFKVFGYYRIVLGVIVFLYFGITALLA